MKLMTTTAALAIAATGAFAESHATEMRSEMHANSTKSAMTTDELAVSQGELIRSRDITGGGIYTANAANDEGWNPTEIYDTVASDWNEIGEIEDLILDKNGKVTGIVAEVGGFMDIADKHVAISVKDLNLVAVDDTTYAYVTRFNEEDLEAMEGIDEGFWN